MNTFTTSKNPREKEKRQQKKAETKKQNKNPREKEKRQHKKAETKKKNQKKNHTHTKYNNTQFSQSINIENDYSTVFIERAHSMKIFCPKPYKHTHMHTHTCMHMLTHYNFIVAHR